MKTCNICKIEKDLTEFNRRGKGYGPYCHPCRKQYDKNLYEKDKISHLARKKIEKQNIRKRNYQFLKEIAKNGCIDCGEKDFVCLDFDHVDPSTKSFQISDIHTKLLSKAKLMIEIEKCVVRCSNCHRKRTAKQFNWYANYI